LAYRETEAGKRAPGSLKRELGTSTGIFLDVKAGRGPGLLSLQEGRKGINRPAPLLGETQMALAELLRS
jgi:hypothetical protein